MGFIDSIVNAFTNASETIVQTILDAIIINPLQQFIGGLMAFLQNILVGTPYPRQSENGDIPAVTSEPAGDLWGTLYTFHNDTFQPLAYFLLFMVILAIIFFDIFESMIPEGTPLGNQVNSKMQNAKSKMFIGFIMVTFWWYLGTLILATSDALANLLVGVVGDEDSTGLEYMWDRTLNEMSSGDGMVAIPLLFPLTILWLAEAIILLVIALIWVIRWFAIYLMMPIMPVMIAIWVMELPGVDRLQDTGEEAMGWFISLAFITLPAAIVIGVSGSIIDTLLDSSSGMAPDSGSEAMEHPNPSALAGYDTQSVISHPEVGANIYGDGVAGLGHVGQPSITDSVGNFFMLLIAILMVAAVPLLAGLAPFWLYKEETAIAARAAAGDPTAMSDAISHFGQEERFDDLQDTIKGGRNMVDAKRGNYESIARRHLDDDDIDDLDDFNRDTVMGAITGEGGAMNSRAAIGAGFGGRAADTAERTKQTANQIKSGAATARDGAVNGAVRVDNAQKMIREHRGELTDVAARNTRTKAMNAIDPYKQKARMHSLANKAGDIRNKPGELRESFADTVAEQKNSIDERLENRRIRHQQIEDMSEADVRRQYEQKGYIPGEGDLETYLSNSSRAMSMNEVNELSNNLSDMATFGKKNPENAMKALDSAQQEISNNLEGVDTETKEEYLNEIAQVKEMVRQGEMSPSQAMQVLEGITGKIQDDVTYEGEIMGDWKEKENMFNKYGANFEDEGEVQAQSHSAGEIANMPPMEEVIAGGYMINDSELADAFEEKGKNLEQFVYNSNDHDNVDELKQDEEALRGVLGPEKLKDIKRGDYTVRDNRMEQAFEESGIDMDEFIQNNEKIDSVEDLKFHPEEIANAVGAQKFNELEVAERFEAKDGINKDAVKEFMGYDDETIEGKDPSLLRNEIQAALQNDLDENKAAELLKKSGVDENEDALSLANSSTDSVAQRMLSSLESGDVDAESASETLQEDLGIDISSSDIESGLDEDTSEMVKEQIKESLQADTVLQEDEAKQLVADISESKVEAQQEYSASVLSKMVENAPTDEAAFELMHENAGAIAVQSGVDESPQLDDGDKQEIVNDLVEQAMDGEEIQSQISEHFHEEFENTQEMLENMGQVKAARDIVSELDDQLDQVADDIEVDVGGDAIGLEDLSGDDASENVSKLAGVDIDELQARKLDAQELDDLGVEVSETERDLADDVGELRFEKAEQKAREQVANKIQDEFGMDGENESLEDYGFTTDPDKAQENDNMEMIDFDNTGEVLKKVGTEKKKKEMAEQIGVEVDEE